ncbi:putative transcriptional regulator [Bacillus sp. TS-2]|nr:putative transcriptional regulator [Bacillus sp. TS-2]
MVYTTGSFEGMKSLNQSTILNVIHNQGPISRANIAKLTKLTPPTVGGLVNELIDRNLVIEEEALQTNGGGRRPIMLSINYSAYYIVGVYAAAEIIRVVLSKLNGEIIFDYVQKLATLPKEEEFIEMIKENISYVLEEKHVDKKQVFGIGVAMHGLVNPDKGIAIFAPHLQLRNLPLKEILEKQFDIPVMIENDVRALALAENWFGQGQGISDFICISVGRGIGSGIVLNSEVYKSSFNTAGEIGHTVVDINGPKCHCGNNGCLEACASETAILDRFDEELKLGQDSILKQRLENSRQELSIDLLFKAAREGDALTIKILEESGKSLGIATANMINLLKPSKIILEGQIFKDDFVFNPLQQMIEQYSLKGAQEEIQIVRSELGKKGMVLGAVTLFINKLFMPGGL